MGLVRKSATSVKDLRSIWDYVAGESGPDRADGLLRTLNDQIQFLSDTPGGRPGPP